MKVSGRERLVEIALEKFLDLLEITSQALPSNSSSTSIVQFSRRGYDDIFLARERYELYSSRDKINESSINCNTSP